MPWKGCDLALGDLFLGQGRNKGADLFTGQGVTITLSANDFLRDHRRQ
jgi:hypothetical protein